jgi:hypothetical protein
LTLKAAACRNLLHLSAYQYDPQKDHEDILSWADEMKLNRSQDFTKNHPKPTWDPATSTPWNVIIETKNKAKQSALTHPGNAIFVDGSVTETVTRGRNLSNLLGHDPY